MEKLVDEGKSKLIGMVHSLCWLSACAHIR